MQLAEGGHGMKLIIMQVCVLHCHLSEGNRLSNRSSVQGTGCSLTRQGSRLGSQTGMMTMNCKFVCAIRIQSFEV